MVGVVPPSTGEEISLDPSLHLRAVCRLRIICSTGERLFANSCGLRRGGGRKGEPGDGNGELDDGTDKDNLGEYLLVDYLNSKRKLIS